MSVSWAPHCSADAGTGEVDEHRAAEAAAAVAHHHHAVAATAAQHQRHLGDRGDHGNGIGALQQVLWNGLVALAAQFIQHLGGDQQPGFFLRTSRSPPVRPGSRRPAARSSSCGRSCSWGDAFSVMAVIALARSLLHDFVVRYRLRMEKSLAVSVMATDRDAAAARRAALHSAIVQAEWLSSRRSHHGYALRGGVVERGPRRR